MSDTRISTAQGNYTQRLTGVTVVSTFVPGAAEILNDLK